MSETDIISTGIVLPSIRGVHCIDGQHRIVRVIWGAGSNREGREDRVDLSPLVDTYKFYRPLREDPDLFATVHVANHGRAIAWGDNDEIDMSASSVLRLAEETMTADDFRQFLERNTLTQDMAALLLGRSPRQLKYYLRAGILPRIVSLACIGLERSLKPSKQPAKLAPFVWAKVSYTMSPLTWNATVSTTDSEGRPKEKRVA